MIADNEAKGQSEAAAMDSAKVAAEVAEGGTLRFYLKTLRTNPRKILIGIWESLVEVVRFVVWPRFATDLQFAQRISLVGKWVRAEVRVPGGTTLLETIWLTYGASLSRSPAKNWVEVGCFKGLSTVRLSLLCGPWGRHLHVYDTFAGLPGSDSVYSAVDNGVAYHFKAGSYAASELDVSENVIRYGDPSSVTLVKGNVDDTLQGNNLGPISFAFLDVDLAQSYKACFQGLAHNIEAGTVIVIHEACYAPIRSLVEDSTLWEDSGLKPPEITYVAERYGIASCRNIAILQW